MESMERRVQVLLRNLRVYSRRTRVQVLAGQHNCKAVNCSQSWSAVEACCVHICSGFNTDTLWFRFRCRRSSTPRTR